MDRKMIAMELLGMAKELVGMEFPTQEALDKYLKDHPDANRSKHKVVKTEKKAPAKKEDSKEEQVSKGEPKKIDWGKLPKGEMFDKVPKKDYLREIGRPMTHGGLEVKLVGDNKLVAKIERGSYFTVSVEERSDGKVWAKVDSFDGGKKTGTHLRELNRNPEKVSADDFLDI